MHVVHNTIIIINKRYATSTSTSISCQFVGRFFYGVFARFSYFSVTTDWQRNDNDLQTEIHRRCGNCRSFGCQFFCFCYCYWCCPVHFMFFRLEKYEYNYIIYGWLSCYLKQDKLILIHDMLPLPTSQHKIIHSTTGGYYLGLTDNGIHFKSNLFRLLNLHRVFAQTLCWINTTK